MSVLDRDGARYNVDLDALGERVFLAVFGDRTGALVFVAAMAFFAIYWRVGLFSTDTYTIANTLVAASEGDLAVTRAVYGPVTRDTPGMHVVEGTVYGRNYGQVAASLIVLRAMQATAAVADLRIAAAGGWSLLLLAGILLAGQRTDRTPLARWIGPVIALGAFGLNAALATPLSPDWWPVIALQSVTAIAAALTAVLLYRLLAHQFGYRVGLAGGLLAFLATPVGFWATIPKRHALTALFAVTVVYAFYRARASDSRREETAFRATAYATTAIAAWVHAPEGLVLFLALAPVDLLTADSNRPRDLAVIATAFSVALVPFLVTNTLIAGNPLQPPRMLQDFTGTGPLGDVAAPEAGGSVGRPDSSSGGLSISVLWSRLLGLATGVSRAAIVLASLLVALPPVMIDRLELLTGHLAGTMGAWFSPDRLVDVFVRSGYIDAATPRGLALDIAEDRAVNLTVLESMPMLGALAGLPILAVRRLRARPPIRLDPWTATNLLILVYLLLFTTMYLARLPLHHMFTVRYLHPLYPLGLVAVLGLPSVRAVIDTRPKLLAGCFAATISIGLPAYLAAIWMLDAVQGEAVQLYALVALAAAAATAGWAVSAAAGRGSDRVGAVVLGVAAGIVTVYLVGGGLGVFAYTDEFLLPIGRGLAEGLKFGNPLRSLL